MGKTRKRVRVKQVLVPERASKVELVTAVLALLGADERPFGVDEIALGCHRVAPFTFSWPEYAWLPNLDNVRVTLVDVGRAGVAETLTEGRHKQKFWRLTPTGRDWARSNQDYLAALRSRLPDPDVVSEHSPADLAAVATLVASEDSSGGPVPSPRVIAEAYRLFPHQFGLEHYPGWPDSSAVFQAIEESTALRNEARLVHLVADEADRISELRRNLHSGTAAWTRGRKRQKRGTSFKAVAQVERSPLYRTYSQEGESAPIGEGEVSSLLSLTLEASPEVIRSRFDLFEGLLEQQERWDLGEFLRWVRAWCEDRDWRLIKEQGGVERD